MLEFGGVSYFIGLGFYAYGSTKYRLPHAPVPGNGPMGWPWNHHDWFARRGRIYRNLGLVLEGIGLLGIVARVVLLLG